MKKKFKLVLSAIMLALALTFVSTAPITAYADDPQGTVEKKPAPSAPAPDWASVIWALLLIW
jgi:hypothetical protein